MLLGWLGGELIMQLLLCLQVENGYVGIKDVRKAPPRHDDTQQSFFLAETLKYLYLMFGDGTEFNLSEWVFNTEAHPLKIMKSVPAVNTQEDVSHREAAAIHLQNDQPGLARQQPPDLITDVVDASLADAVADEDRANLNALHDNLDRSTDESVKSVSDLVLHNADEVSDVGGVGSTDVVHEDDATKLTALQDAQDSATRVVASVVKDKDRTE